MSAEAIAAALGGSKVLEVEVHSEFDLASAAKRGISAEAACAEVANGLLTAEELYMGARMVERTLGRIEHGMYS